MRFRYLNIPLLLIALIALDALTGFSIDGTSDFMSQCGSADYPDGWPSFNHELDSYRGPIAERLMITQSQQKALFEDHPYDVVTVILRQLLLEAGDALSFGFLGRNEDLRICRLAPKRIERGELEMEQAEQEERERQARQN